MRQRKSQKQKFGVNSIEAEKIWTASIVKRSSNLQSPDHKIVIQINLCIDIRMDILLT